MRQYTICLRESGEPVGRIILGDIIEGWKCEIWRKDKQQPDLLPSPRHTKAIFPAISPFSPPSPSSKSTNISMTKRLFLLIYTPMRIWIRRSIYWHQAAPVLHMRM